MMLVLHDDKEREYAYGPANGLPDTKVGTFSQALYDEAKSKDWTVISMKNDWKQMFSFAAVARFNDTFVSATPKSSQFARLHSYRKKNHVSATSRVGDCNDAVSCGISCSR